MTNLRLIPASSGEQWGGEFDPDAFDPAGVVDVHASGRSFGPVRRTYADVAVGEPIALVGSSGLLEVAVRQGSAAGAFGVTVGTLVDVRL